MSNLERIVGIDLGREVSQLSSFDMEKMEPGGEREIPTLLCRLPGGWLAGEEALRAEEAGEGLGIRGFLEEDGQDPIEAGGEIFSKADLLAIYLEEILREEDAAAPAYLTITAETIRPALAAALAGARERLGVAEDRFSIVSHVLSAQFFALSQKRELWMHDVGIFEYDKDGLRYEHLSISGQKHPAIVQAQVQDLRSFLDGHEIGDDEEETRDEAFLKAMAAAAGEAQVSTFYLVGPGFSSVGEGSSWMKRSLQALCAKRRHVFVGQNFYVKGACYNSYYMAMPSARPEFVAANTELTTDEVFLYVTQRGKLARLPLVPVQTAWFTAVGKAAVLPVSGQTLTIGLQNAVTGETRRYQVNLEGMPERPAKTTKLLVRARFAQEDLLSVRIEDLGFGEIFPASGKTWEETFSIKERDESGKVRSLQGEPAGQLLETALPGSAAPFPIPRTGLSVYAFDELCWFVKENVPALDRDFFDERLFSWLDGITGADTFSTALRRMKEDKRSMQDLVRYLLSASDYVTLQEIKETASVLAAAQKQDAAERAAVVAGYYYRYGRYLSAAEQYQHAIWIADHDPESMVTRSEKADLWHNLGLALLRLGDRKGAADCIRRAFQENEDPTLVSECLSIYYMSGEEDAFHELAEKYRLPESLLSSITARCDAASLDYETSPRAASLEETLSQPDGKGALACLEEIKSRFI